MPGGSCRAGLGPPALLGIATPSRISANPGWANPALPAPHHGAPEPDGRFYEPLAAQELLARHESELALRPVPVEELRYVPRRGRYLPAGVIERDAETAVDLGEEELRRRLSADEEIPDWFSYPEVIDELRRVYPPRSRQGFALFFTGLSGAGKSTLAKLAYAKLVEAGGRPVSLLDGDIVRRNLSSELGFSRAHRDLNVRRIGFVASEITKNGGVALCAPIAPYTATRRAVRELIRRARRLHRDPRRHPARSLRGARPQGPLREGTQKGIIPEFTGISDPYEVPEHPEIRLDTTDLSPVEGAGDLPLSAAGGLSGCGAGIAALPRRAAFPCPPGCTSRRRGITPCARVHGVQGLLKTIMQ